MLHIVAVGHNDLTTHSTIIVVIGGIQSAEVGRKCPDRGSMRPRTCYVNGVTLSLVNLAE